MEASGNTAKESKKDAKKAPAGDDQDLSMEEILQSIRRIIAEDDDETKKGDKPAKPKAKAEEDVTGSEVLELTEMLKEDGTTVNVKEAPKPAAPAAAPPTDVLSAIDNVLAPEKPPEPPKAAEPLPVTPPPPMPVAAPAAVAALAPEVKPLAIPADTLLSDAAAAAAADAFRKLRSADDHPVEVTAAPSFRSGSTVEDLVTEMLRPMMKAWLDINLPPIVERIVEREVRKLSHK